jgi:hypothetical protein
MREAAKEVQKRQEEEARKAAEEAALKLEKQRIAAEKAAAEEAAAKAAAEEAARKKAEAKVPAAPEPAPGLAPGARVRIFGLQSGAGLKLNGLEGNLQAFSPENGRWHVILDSGEVKTIKAKNLEVSEDEECYSPLSLAMSSPEVKEVPKKRRGSGGSSVDMAPSVCMRGHTSEMHMQPEQAQRQDISAMEMMAMQQQQAQMMAMQQQQAHQMAMQQQQAQQAAMQQQQQQQMGTMHMMAMQQQAMQSKQSDPVIINNNNNNNSSSSSAVASGPTDTGTVIVTEEVVDCDCCILRPDDCPCFYLATCGPLWWPCVSVSRPVPVPGRTVIIHTREESYCGRTSLCYAALLSSVGLCWLPLFCPCDTREVATYA